MADLNVAIELVGRDNASGVVQNVVKSLGGIPEAAGKAEGLLGSLTSGFGKLGLAGLGIKTLADTVGGFATSLVSGNSQMENYETQLGTLMGSADAAKEELKKLADFGAKTPFELPEIAAADKVLIGFGLTGQKVFKMTGQNADDFRTTVGDIAAGTGADFQEIALNMGKFSAGATGEAIARFQEMGIVTREQLSAMGVEFSKSGELLSPLPQAMQAIVKVANEKFGGGMDKLSKTFSGQMSTLSDNINQAKNAIMQPIFNVLRDSLANINNLISTGGFQSALKNIADLMAGAVAKGVDIAKGAFGAFFDLISSGDIGLFADDLREAFSIDITGFVEPIRAAEAIIGEFSTRIGTFFDQLSNGATLATTVNAAFGDLIPASLNPILDAVDKSFATIKDSVTGLISAFQQGGLAGVWQQIADAMAAFAPTGERVSSAIDAIGKAILAIIPQPVQDFVAGLFSMGTNAAEGFDPIQALASVINTLSGALASATKFVQDHTAAQAALVAILAGAGAAFAISAAVSAYASAVAIAQGAVAAFTAVQGALNIVLSANPIGLVIIALAALTAGLIYAYKNSDEFRQAVDTAFSTVKTVTLGVISAVNQSIQTFSAAMTAVGSVAGTIQGTITDAWNTVQTSVTTAVTAVQTAITSTWDTINTYISGIIDAIKKYIMDFWDGLPADVQDDLSTIYGYIVTQFGKYLSFISTTMGSIEKTIADAWGTITSNVSTAMQAVSDAVSAGWEVISGVVTTAMGTISGLIQTGWSTIQTIISTTMETISGIVSVAWEGVRAVIEEKINAAIVIVSGFVTKIQDVLTKMRDTVVELAKGVGESIVDGIKGGAAAVWGALVDYMTGQIRSLLSSMATAIRASSPSKDAADKVGAPIMQGITMGIKQETPMTVAAAQSSAIAIVNAFSGIKQVFNTQYIVDMLNNFNNAAKQNLGDLGGFITGWIAEVVAHRTELLKRFNYAAYLRGEGTKVMPELTELSNNFIRDTTAAAVDVAGKLQKIATDLQDTIMQARADAYAAAQAITNQAVAQVRQIQEQAALQKEIKMQRDAFAAMQQQAKDYFNAQQAELQSRLKIQEDIARIGYTAALKLSRVGQDENPDVTAAQKALDIKTQLYQIDYEAHRDTLRAQTDLEKQEIQKRAGDARLALQDQLDEEKALYEATQQERQNLQIAEIEAEKKNALQGLIDQQNEEIAVRNATAVLRAAITDRQTQFDQMQAAQAADFEKSMDDAAFARQVNQIYAERDAKIKAVAEQLADKEKQLTDSAEKERQIILDNLAQQLKDYKSKYIDQITEAFHHAGVDIADFYGLINDHLATQVDATTKKILDMIAQVKNIQQGVFSPNMFPAPAVPLPINAPTYPATTYPGPDVAGIGAFDSGTNNASRVINLQLTVNGAQPVTADQIAREINRSLSLAGV